MRRLLIFSLLLALIPLLAAETVLVGGGVNSAEVISSTGNETVIQFNLGKYEKTRVEIDKEEWFQLGMPREGKLLDAGFPELPVMNRSIIIDDQALMKIEVYDLEYEEIEIPIAPSKGDLTRDIDPATVPYTFDAMYQKDEFYPGEIATLSEPYIMRDFRGIVVRTVPFAYNPVTRTLRIYTSYKVRVYAEGMDTVNVLTTSRNEISREFMGIYENHFLNWDDSRYTSVSDSFGTLLIIYYNDFEDAITPYFEWKRQKGMLTYFVPYSATGATNAAQLQVYIQNRYNSDPGITFVQLVGDAAQIPTLSVDGGGADPVYALVSGTDSYPDIFVSRFSASTAAEVTTQVNKVITYERDFTTSQGWLQWATGVASGETNTGDDGETDEQHMENIRDDLLAYGYTVVDQVYPSNPPCTADQLASYLNAGSSLLNYCGHGSTISFGTTGFNTTDVANLTNGVKTPVICSVACLNGNFVSYTCLAEAFLRKSGGGGIAFYGSSINQSWSPPMAGQDEVVDLLVADAKTTVGGLFFNGSCKMLDDYPTSTDMYKTWNIFGDASMLTRTKNPMTMTVTHTDVINVGETSTVSVITGVPYAYVGITYDNAIPAHGYADNVGNFTATITPTDYREYTVTVTAHNRVTYVGKIYAGYIWDGSSSTVWSDGANWNVGTQPYYTKDVLIPNGCPRYPVTSNSAGYARNFRLESGTSITVGAYDLVVFGNAYMFGQLNMTHATDFEVSADVIWGYNSTASISNSNAEIYVGGHMLFNTGSNVQLAMGYLEFNGTAANCHLINKSPNTQIYNLRSDMGDGRVLVIHDDSTYDLVINGSVWNYTGSSLYCYYTGNVFINGMYFIDYNSTTTYGIKMYYPTVIMGGGTQYIGFQGPNCYLNNLTISSTGTVTLQADLILNNDLRITSGIFDPGGWGIELGGDWINFVGPAAFNEGTSTVTFNGSAHQYCNNSETFNILEVDCGAALRVNNSAAVVTCAQYDWISGGIDVLAGTFTANDLVDDGIFGSFYVNPGATINLTNNDGYVDINGDLVFSGGGTINVFGGTDYSYWPYESPGSIIMSGGTLDFKDQSIWVNNGYDFTANISGGTIRTVGNFQVYRNDFNPTGGTMELVGSADCVINHDAGSSFFNLVVNKSAGRGETKEAPYQTDREGRTRRITRTNTVSADSDLDINGYFKLLAGSFVAPAQLNVMGSWYNYVGEAAFNEGTGLVVFDGNSHSSIYANEVFNAVELNKDLPTTNLNLASTHSLTCNSYDWTQGGLNVTGGTFSALDMVDSLVLGNVTLTSGYIHMHQQGTQYLDIRADIAISGGEMHLYGTAGGATIMPYGGDASFTMSDGVFHRHDISFNISSSNTLTSSVTGGTIRTDQDFYCYRADFNPSGGLLEMCSSTDASIYMSAGSLFSLKINKTTAREGEDGLISSERRIYYGRQGEPVQISRTNTVTADSDLDINGAFSLTAGSFIAPAQMNVRGSWYNYVGEAAFNEGSGLVVFDGNAQTTIYANEVFNAIELNKSHSTIPLNLASTRSLVCASYDWTLGTLNVTGGSFTTNDLVDAAILGTVNLSAGYIHFHQGADQFIDLAGTWNISGGELHLYGGDGSSFWPYATSGEINMSAGLIHRHDNGIYIPGTHVLTENITGGTIRTDGNFACWRSDFTPSGGTLEFVGPNDSEIYNSPGTFYDIVINKGTTTVLETNGPSEPLFITDREGNQREITRTNTVSLGSNIICNGNLSVVSGTFSTAAHNLNCAGNVDVNSIMSIPASGALIMSSGKTINVNNGGTLNVIGNSTNASMVTCSSGYYGFDIESGGTLGANYGIFEYVNNNGIWVKPGAIVDPDHSLSNCTFRLGYPGGRLLLINNNQAVTISGSVFPANTWSGAYNVSKTLGYGSVNFIDWSGDFGGPDYEQDSYGLIDWEFMGLPMIEDLSISYIPASNQIRLDWTYPIPDTQFKIYRSSLPEGPFSFVGASTDEFWTQDVPGPIFFYRVTAYMP